MSKLHRNSVYFCCVGERFQSSWSLMWNVAFFFAQNIIAISWLIKIRYSNMIVIMIFFYFKSINYQCVSKEVKSTPYKMWNMCLNKHVLHCNENFSILQEMAVMKQAILGLHSSRGSTSQVNRTSTGVHGPESRLRTSTAQDTSSQVTHRPKPTIFVSWKSLILETSGNSLKLLLYLPWDDSELLFLSAF